MAGKQKRNKKFDTRRKTTSNDVRRENSKDAERLYGEIDKPKKDNRYCDVTNATGHKYNDVAWYAKNESLLRDSASFSYNNPLGSPFRLDQMIGNSGAVTISRESVSVPGLMAIETYITPGVADSATSPINVAKQNIYSFTRYMNSGATNYDSPDQMLYLLAMDSLYAAWNWAKRLYGAVGTYSQYNRYMPEAYCAANKVDMNDLIMNLSDFRAFLNVSAAKITSFCCPATMPFMVRHSWMFSNIYKDSDTEKAQQYIFVPGGFYQYDETTSPDGGILAFVPVVKDRTTLMKTTDIINMLNSMIDALSYSEDIGVMSGDILKAFGKENLFALSAVEPDYTVMPVYNEEVLTQIHNLTTVDFVTTTDLTIKQNPNTNWIIFNPDFGWKTAKPRTAAILNLPWQDVTPANTMVASRLTTMVDAVSASSDAAKATAMGSEFVHQLTIYYYDNPNSTTIQNSYTNFELQSISFTQTLNISAATGSRVNAQLIVQISNFDWHPLISIWWVPTSGSPNIMGFMGDINTYTFVTSDRIQMMNSTALLSEFNVPAVGGTF